MAVNWKELEKLLPYLKAWAEENQQFKNELLKMFNSPSTAIEHEKERNEFRNSNINELLKQISEIKRTSYYLKAIDTNFSKEAKTFYNYYKIRNKTLLVTLCRDFKLMRISETENDVVDYARYIILQLENIINFIVNKLDAHTLIQNNSNLYIDKKSNLIEGEYSFFSMKGANNVREWNKGGKIYFERDYTKLEMPVKMNFIRMHYGFWYDFIILSEMNFLRNRASHRGERKEDSERLLKIKNLPFNVVKSNYMNCFKTILDNIKDLHLE